MKTLKKFIGILLSTCLIFTSTQFAFAKNLSHDEKVNILISKGIPSDALSNADDFLLDELLKDEGEFVSVTVTNTNFDKEGNVIESTSGDASTMGTMPSSDFELTVFAQRINEKTGSNFKFTANGRWNIQPLYSMVDLAALAWSDSFTLYEDSCTYRFYNGSQWNYINCPKKNVNPEAGVSHEVDLDGHSYWNGGSYTQVAKVNLYPASVGSANVVAGYAHKWIGIGNIGAEFSPGGESAGISFSSSLPTVFFDEAIPAYTYFEY